MNASGETRKTIVINEGFIDPNGTLIHSSSRRKNPANKTQKNIKPSTQSKEISKQVLQKIRDRYKNISLAEPEQMTNIVPEQTPVVNEENRDLVQSIDFLEKLTQNVQSRPPPSPQNPSYYKPHELHRSYTPQYGCLKKGILPTYRMLNTTQKYRPIISSPSHSLTLHNPHTLHNPSPHPTQPIQYWQQGNSGQIPVAKPKPILNEPIDQEIKDLSIRSQFAEIQQGFQGGNAQSTLPDKTPHPENNISPNYQKRIVRRTHRVGRSKRLPVVSVLLPNKTICSKVATHSKTLKTLPMPQVKNSLVKTGMIKIGTDAPENVLREIYENMCLIGGPVMNYNPDVLYYNMLHNS